MYCFLSTPEAESEGVFGHLWTFRDVTFHSEAAERLELARQTAEQAARAKSEFLATMSHEIRTPLNGVIGMNELIVHQANDDQIREYAGIAHRSGTALMALINDILDFSRIEAGQMPVEQRPFVVRDVVADVFEILRERAGRAGHLVVDGVL